MSSNLNSLVNVWMDRDNQHLIVAYRDRYVMPYPHGGSKVIGVFIFGCVCTCVYHHMFDSADLTHGNECCQRG